MGDPSPIPFAEGEASGLSELSGAQPILYNLLPDAAGALRIRPGIQAWSDYGTAPAASAVIGMFPWRQYLIFVLANRSVYAWQASGSVLNLNYTLAGTGRPIFAYDQARVVFTGGGMPGKWEGAGNASDLAPGQIMPDGSNLALTHIAYIAQRLVGNDNNNSAIYQWTAPGQGNHATWPVSGSFYAEAEAAPDPLVALYANSNEVYLFGTESTQVSIPDPTLVFAVASSQSVGCAAPYSVINTDQDFAWLDNDRRFTQSGGREFKVLSSPGMAKTVSSIATVSDCWGARIKFQMWDLLVWVFPTQGTAIWFDRVTQKWGEFRSLDSNGEWVAWLPQSYVYWADKNLHLVGLSDGTIGQLTMDATSDMGSVLKGVARTGFQDLGTFSRKTCQRVDFQFRRDAAVGATPTDPRVEYRYRDDLGAWSSADFLALGGQYQPVVTKWSKGQFRQRQHEISLNTASDFILAGATMTTQTMES